MSDVLSLYRLQQLDSRLTVINSRLAVIMDALENNSSLADAKLKWMTTEKTKTDITNRLSQKENESRTRKIKITQVESTMYSGGVSNPKELQDLQLELDSLKRQLSSLEDLQLEDMLTLEKAVDENEAAELTYQATLARVEKEYASLVIERDSLTKETEKLQRERRATVDSINSQSLKLYNEIRERRHGIAVTTISDNSCDSCGAVLTPAQRQAAHHSNQIFRCQSCGRIVYY